MTKNKPNYHARISKQMKWHASAIVINRFTFDHGVVIYFYNSTKVDKFRDKNHPMCGDLLSVIICLFNKQQLLRRRTVQSPPPGQYILFIIYMYIFLVHCFVYVTLHNNGRDGLKTSLKLTNPLLFGVKKNRNAVFV